VRRRFDFTAQRDATASHSCESAAYRRDQLAGSRALIASIVVLLPAAVLAQAYPTKPIRLIVPFAPGGTNDILARIVATHLSQTLGQNMIVDNRPGFQGVIGTDLAVKAAPDGYTLLMVSSAYTMNPVLVKLCAPRVTWCARDLMICRVSILRAYEVDEDRCGAERDIHGVKEPPAMLRARGRSS
jgi:hypothetical protein